jgi:hypothetical protein
MSVGAAEWQAARALSGDELKGVVFSFFQRLSADLQTVGSDDPAVLESVPRLAELLDDKVELDSFREPFSALARATGLWNYIDREHASTPDLLLAEAVTAPELDNITLHREQIEALNVLLSGRNLILSAPTSFGKSILIDALLSTGRYQRIAIVLPTIALMDEFRRRLTRRFGGQFQLVMHASDRTESDRVIFLGTQERLVNRADLGLLDLTVVDEFYKLDPSRVDDRSLTLNAAVYKLLAKSNQFFFLGPNIDGVRFTEGTRWRFEFLQTRYSTVAVDTFDLSKVDDKQARLIEEASRKENWPALVFISSPDKANGLAEVISEQHHFGEGGDQLADWLRTNVGKRSLLAQSVAAGVGIHHGRIPRAIASHIVRLFNDEKLPVLICTSTLIEGVNTAARSVLIYDKQIDRADYDFFTFSNIRGRAGRLGQHHVGQVYLFNEPPPHEEMQVEPPLFADFNDVPDELIVHLEGEDITRRVDERVTILRENLNLDPADLKIAASIGLEDALALKQHTEEALRKGSRVQWGGLPRFEELLDVAALISRVKRLNAFGVFTPKHLAYYVNELSRSDSLREFLLKHDEGFKGADVGRDNVFKFLRACEYGLPQYLSVVNLFVQKAGGKADYSYFIGELSRWFRPEVLKNLDEEGIPVQISERLYERGDDAPLLRARLLTAAAEGDDRLSQFERDWVEAALA